MDNGRFLVARNPDAESSLPYLVRLPIGGGLVLKARESWPRTAKVYCHRAADGEWHDALELIEDVGVRSCLRNGVAIDLVLDRKQEHRSQFVFTRMKGGREGIFWQSAKTTRKARPSVRMPGRRASHLAAFTITLDTRERYPYRFVKQQAATKRMKLPVGDYAVRHEGQLIATVERKSLADLTKGLTEGSLAYQVAELSTYPRAAVVVEERYSQVFASKYVQGGWVADLIAQLNVRTPPSRWCSARRARWPRSGRFASWAPRWPTGWTNPATPPPRAPGAGDPPDRLTGTHQPPAYPERYATTAEGERMAW